MIAKKYNIDISQTIGQIVPFYARGRKLSLFLEAICSPLDRLHKKWQLWAEERIIEASITSQAMSLTWYLNHKLRKHFVNKSDSFVVNNGLDTPENILFTEAEYLESDEFSQHIYSASEQRDNLTMTIRSYQEVMEACITFSIYPPIIEETTSYNNTNYRNDITRLVNKYNTSFKQYQIYI